MRFEAADLQCCRDGVTRVLHEMTTLLRGIDAEAVTDPLARCANRLHDDPPAPPEEVALLLRAVVGAASVHVAHGRLSWETVQSLLEPYNAALRRPFEDSSLFGYAPEVAAIGPRSAIWSPPTTLRLWEQRISMPPGLKERIWTEVSAARTEFATQSNDDRADEPVDARDTESSQTPVPSPPALERDDEQNRSDEPLPPVRFCPELATIRPLFQHYALVVEQALDSMALLGAHRLLRTISEAPDEELRIWALLDAALTTGLDLPENVEHWWALNLDSPDEWKVWAPCLVLGSVEDARSPVTLDRILNDLDPELTGQVDVAAQGLHLARSPVVGRLVHEIRRSSNPIKRAVGVTAASFRAELSAEDVAMHLTDPSPVVIEAALRAAGRLSQLPVEVQDRLVLFLHGGLPRFVQSAAKALLLHGRQEPLRELQHGSLETSLGDHLLEFLVWTGGETDVPRIERHLRGRELSGEQLLKIGQFGHPGMWSFLAHFLSDEELQDDAAYALTLLLGPGVDADDRYQAGAWESQVHRVAPDSQARYRLGQPFHVGSVQQEYQLRAVSYLELQDRLDEAAIRTGIRVDVPLHGWNADSEGQLQRQFTKLQQVASAIRPGTWDVRGGR